MVVDGKLINIDLMRTFIIWTLDNTVLWEFANALITEGVTTGKRDRFLLVVIVGLEANATLKY